MTIKMLMIHCILYLCTNFKLLYCSNDYPQCNHVINPVFKNCSRKSDPLYLKPDFELCNHSFTMAGVRKQMFYFTIQYLIEDMIYYCCSNTTKVKRIKRYFYVSDVNEDNIQDSDFVYPIIARYTQETLHGYYFVPVYDLPRAYYLTRMKSTEKVVRNLTETCLALWPLLLICLLAAIIAGFIIWGLETRLNVVEFPRRFHIGLFEGFWWSFTTMTTVGYGDKSPRSVAGRLFAICWIMIGITICSIFNAALTSEIIHEREEPHADLMNLQGKRVGCLNYRINDAILAAQHGGIVKTIEYNNTWLGIGRLIEMIDEKTIDGFILNSQTYYDFLYQLKKPKYAELAVRAKKVDLLVKSLENKEERLSYGFLVRNKHYYEYFHKYVKNNCLQLQTCNHVKNNRKYSAMPKFKMDLFSQKGGLFTPFLNSSLGILAGIFTIGLFYELIKFVLKKKVYKMEKVDDNNNNGCRSGCFACLSYKE